MFVFRDVDWCDCTATKFQLERLQKSKNAVNMIKTSKQCSISFGSGL